MAVEWIIRTVDPVAVSLPGLNVGQVAMPDKICLLAEGNTVGFFFAVIRIKEAEFNALGVR